MGVYPYLLLILGRLWQRQLLHMSRSEYMWYWNLGHRDHVASILFPETHELGSLHTKEVIRLSQDLHAVRSPSHMKMPCAVALVDSLHWVSSLSDPSPSSRYVSNETFKWFQTQPFKSHLSLESFQLRCQTSWNRDKPPLLGRIWIIDPRNHEHN